MSPASASSQFLSLPSEIRLAIYHYAIQDLFVVIHVYAGYDPHHDTKYVQAHAISSRKVSDANSCMLALLRTCHQIKEEVASMAFNNVTGQVLFFDDSLLRTDAVASRRFLDNLFIGPWNRTKWNKTHHLIIPTRPAVVMLTARSKDRLNEFRSLTSHMKTIRLRVGEDAPAIDFWLTGLGLCYPTHTRQQYRDCEIDQQAPYRRRPDKYLKPIMEIHTPKIAWEVRLSERLSYMVRLKPGWLMDHEVLPVEDVQQSIVWD